MGYTVLYFGSFNPPHNGHTAVARYVAGQKFCDELWFVVSPSNPLKDTAILAPEQDRLAMMRIAVQETLAGLPVEVCDVEFAMPRPSYTIDTMRELGRLFPERRFAILGGTDMIEGISRWKESERLLEDYKFFIYPRGGCPTALPSPNVTCLDDAPEWEFSSTDVRGAAATQIGHMVCPGVAEYIKTHHLYGN